MEGFMIAGAVLGLVGTGMQAHGQKEAAQDAKRANRQKSAIEAVHSQKAAVRTLQMARIKRAAIQASAANTGARGSGEQGAIGSIATQTGASLGFQNVNTQSSKNITRTLNNQTSAEELAGLGGSARDLGGQAFQFGKGLG